MTRKQLPFFLAFLVLLFGAMACACLGSGAGVGGFQATANAAYTQAAGAAATAGAQGNSLAATANAAATAAASGGNTSSQPTATTASAEATSSQPTATTAAAEATSATSGGNGTTASGGPSDIPVMQDNTNLVATAQLVSYQTKSDSNAVIAFYKDAMPKNGWAANAAQTVESPAGSVLAFTKSGHAAVITIAKDPSSGLTTVAIVVQ